MRLKTIEEAKPTSSFPTWEELQVVRYLEQNPRIEFIISEIERIDKIIKSKLKAYDTWIKNNQIPIGTTSEKRNARRKYFNLYELTEKRKQVKTLKSLFFIEKKPKQKTKKE